MASRTQLMFMFAFLVTWVTSTTVSPTPLPSAIPTSAPSLAPRYLFGQSAPLTGSSSRLGHNLQNGIIGAFRKINDAGGIHGYMLDLVTLDDGGVPAIAVNNTQALIEQKVLGCVSYFGGDAVSGSLSLLEPYRIPMIAPYSGSRAFRFPVNRYVLHARASTDEEMHAWVSYCLSRGVTLFAVYYQEDENGYAGFKSIKSALKNKGLGILVSSSFPVGGNVSIAGIKSAMISPQSIVMIGDPVAMGNFTALAKNQWPACLFHMVSYGSHTFLDTLIERNVSAAEAKNIFVTQVMPVPQTLEVLNTRNLPPISLGHTRFLWDFALAMNSTFPGVDSISLSTVEGFMAGMFISAILTRMQPFDYNSSRLRPYLDKEGVNETTISLDDEASLRAWRDYMIDTLFVESMVDVSGIRLGPFVPNITCPADAFDCLQPPSPPCTQGLQNVFLVQPDVANRTFIELFDWRVPSHSCNAFSQDTPSGEIPLVFGQSAVLSGTALGNQDLGYDMRNGILAAFAEANKSPAKGVRGRPLLLLTMDDRYDANQAKINARALIANQSLVAVLGALGTGPTEAVIPLYAAAGIPLVGTLSGARSMRQSGLINIRALYDDEVAAMVDLAISRGVKKFSVYKQMDVFGDAGENAARLVLQYHKLSLHSVSFYNRTLPDPYPAFRNFTDTGVPEAIIMFSTVLISAQFIELTLNDTAWGSTLFLMASPCDPDRLHPRLSKAALQTGRVHATTVVPPVGNDAFSTNFLAALQLIDPRLFTGTLAPYTPTFTAMEGYLIGRFAIAAMARVTEFTGKAMLGEIYVDQGITIDGIKMGPYTSSCNMGRRTVHIVRFEDSNTSKFTRVSDFRAQPHNSFIPDCGAYTLYDDANFSCPDGYRKEYVSDSSLASTCRLCLSEYGCFVPERVANMRLRGGLLALNIIGFIVAVLFIGVVWKYRQTVTIRAVSPPFCVIILLGAMLGYIFVFIQYEPVPTAEVCMAQVYVLNTCCCLLFGSLFAKVFRVTQIFKRPKDQSLRILKIRDSTLFLGVGVLWCVEMVFTAIWHSTSPLVPVHLTSAKEQYWTCEAENPLWGVVDILVNAIFLLYGVLLSVQSRRIPTVFNEAKFVAATMYNTLILGVIAILLGYGATNNNDDLFTYKAVGIFVICTVDIGLLIGSKFPSLYAEVVKGKIPEFKNESNSASAGTSGGNSGRATTVTRESANSRPGSPTVSRAELEKHSPTVEVEAIPIDS